MTSPGDITPPQQSSPDGRFATQRPAVSAGAFFWAIGAALLIVVVGVLLGYGMVTANDAVECSIENVERSQQGLPPLDCPR